jgi:tetratricopeptide (TPR) repeat protein
LAGSLEAYTWNRLDAIYREISAENYDAAYADLQKLLDRSGSDPYLQAIVYQALAYIEGLSDDPGAALEFLQSAIELDALPDAAHYALVFQAAQLQYGRQHYDEASRLLDAWFCASPGDVPATAYALRASLYLQEPDYAGALEAVNEAIRLEHDPPGSWYRLKVAALYELERYPEAAETLEAMIARWPGEKEFWVQLSQIQYRLKNTDRSLAVAALAYRNGLLDRQGDILYLSGLYREAGNPYRSAEVLEAGVRAGIVESSPYHWTRIAETWLEANETGRSLSAWREAAALSPDGSADLRRGFILVDQERWTAALEALDLALEKGGLDAGGTGNGYLLRGISRFELGDYDAAEADWSEAEHYDGVDQAARQWMDHLRTVRRRAVS